MPAPAVMALLSIFVELTGSALVLIDRWGWLGAGMLGVFTAIGAVTAHAFWKVSGRARVEATAVFLMHLGLIAAFVLCALITEREGRAVQVSESSATSSPQFKSSADEDGHDHANAWSAKLPISDLKAFWRAIGWRPHRVSAPWSSASPRPMSGRSTAP